MGILRLGLTTDPSAHGGKPAPRGRGTVTFPRGIFQKRIHGWKCLLNTQTRRDAKRMAFSPHRRCRSLGGGGLRRWHAPAPPGAPGAGALHGGRHGSSRTVLPSRSYRTAVKKYMQICMAYWIRVGPCGALGTCLDITSRNKTKRYAQHLLLCLAVTRVCGTTLRGRCALVASAAPRAPVPCCRTGRGRRSREGTRTPPLLCTSNIVLL